MCLILLAWRAHPDYPLVLAANRDEFHARPAAPAAWWPDPDILAGRDRTAGGTWLGVARDGRFAALTNYRDPVRLRPDAPSRGALVPEILAVALPAEAQLARLRHTGSRYNDFNLIFSDGKQLAVFESVPTKSRILGPGLYGLSNHLLDTPWPKVRAGKSALGAALARLPDDTPLLELLRDDAQADDGDLPRTGVSLQWERLLSSAFIRTPEYGTRCSTVLLLDAHGEVRLDEWTWNAAGTPAGRVAYRFRTTRRLHAGVPRPAAGG
jgi:uncharacterized protein with NRDE domain